MTESDAPQEDRKHGKSNNKPADPDIRQTPAPEYTRKGQRVYRMKQGFFRVTENRPLTNPGGGGQIFLMKLEGDTQAITRPGQFVNLKIDGLYLRPPDLGMRL